MMYSEMGRPSIAREVVASAAVAGVLYTVRSERLLMEELNYNLLFRWFVGLNMDDAAACRIRDQSEQTQTGGRDPWLDEDGGRDAEIAASWATVSGADVYLRGGSI
jgi:Transposase domain (DUF772)